MNALIAQEKAQYEIMEKVIAEGDLSKLSSQERISYYNKVCESLNLNPLTRPFEYIKLNGKLTFYARKDCTEQLRKNNKVSITKMENKTIEGVYVVTVYARSMDGQEDVSTGAVTIKGLQGDALANAFLKAETKAKRRVTLSICGLGFTDESEIETIPNAQIIKSNPETGDILIAAPQEKAIQEISPADLISFDDSIRMMQEAQTESFLREVYTKAYKKFKNHEDFLTSLTAEKDKNKLRIDEELKQSSEVIEKLKTEPFDDSPMW